MTSAGIGKRVTLAVADFVLSALLVAVMTDVVLAVTQGAVNRPLLETVPAVAFQVTPVSAVLETVAVNCDVPKETRLVVVGVTDTPMGALPATGEASTDNAAQKRKVTRVKTQKSDFATEPLTPDPLRTI
jgi:hypothetical protein